jgi:heme-degrading monooxygenase HmoA
MDSVIARRWRGRTRAADLDPYLAYLEASGIPALRATKGNRGVLVFRAPDPTSDAADFEVVSLWEGLDDVRAFAGDDIDRARFFPEDDRFLIDRELAVRHETVEVYPAVDD